MLVIKIGGGEGIDFNSIAGDVEALLKTGEEMIIIHGGSHNTNVIAAQLGHPPQFVTSPSGHTSRRTDRKTMEIFQMVYCGLMNKRLVEILQKRGINAIGLSGMDGRIWEGQRKAAIRIVEDGKTRVLRDDYTGRIENVNTTMLTTLLEMGYVPVLTPPAISFEGEAINVDGDRAAGITATRLKADSLIILSNIPGLLRDPEDVNSLIPEVNDDNFIEMESFAQGRMKKKVMGARDALAGGVGNVIIADARRNNPLITALEGRGTVFI